MKHPSRSPDRHSFQKEGYVKRMKEQGKPVNEDYLDWHKQVVEEHNHKFDDPESRKDNMEYDLLTTEWILDKVRASDAYAQNLYAAMCNREFTKRELWPVLKDQRWSCSWRYAGGIIADMRREGDYIDWYCSGMGGLNQEYDNKETAKDWSQRTGYVAESQVTEEIERDLNLLGWIVCPEEDSQ